MYIYIHVGREGCGLGFAMPPAFLVMTWRYATRPAICLLSCGIATPNLKYPYPDAPWCWNICLHLGDFWGRFWVNIPAPWSTWDILGRLYLLSILPPVENIWKSMGNVWKIWNIYKDLREICQNLWKYGGFPLMRIPNSWLVYCREYPNLEMDDGGTPISGKPHILGRIIPTDELLCFRGIETTNQYQVNWEKFGGSESHNILEHADVAGINSAGSYKIAAVQKQNHPIFEGVDAVDQIPWWFPKS